MLIEFRVQQNTQHIHTTQAVAETPVIPGRKVNRCQVEKIIFLVNRRPEMPESMITHQDDDRWFAALFEDVINKFQ